MTCIGVSFTYMDGEERSRVLAAIMTPFLLDREVTVRPGDIVEVSIRVTGPWSGRRYMRLKRAMWRLREQASPSPEGGDER